MPEVKEVEVNFSTTDVIVPTTTETVVISSGPVRVPTHTFRVLVLAWCQLTLGTATTYVTPRIRRGTTTADPLVGEANTEIIKGAAGDTEPFFLIASEERQGEEKVEYSLTVQQTAATADGTARQQGIVVLIL